MKIYKRYITLSLLMPVLVVIFTLTGIIWLTQALKFIDLIVNKGLDVSTFLYLSILLIPSLLMIILPVAVFFSVLYIYNKLSSDSELLVLKSAGIGQLGLALPAIYVAVIITTFNYLISLYILPTSYREFKETQEFIRNNYASVLLQEGVFSTPIERLTVYIESRDQNGILHGIMVHDARNPERPVTMMAQEGKLIQTDTGPRFELLNGNRQEIDRKNGNLSLVYFDLYPFDVSLYTDVKMSRSLTAEERYINNLIFNQEKDLKLQKTLIAEGHHRIIWPFFVLTVTLVAAATLFSGQFNRRGQFKRLFVACVIVAILVVLDLGFKNLASANPWLSVLMYLNILLPAAFSLHILATGKSISGFELNSIKKLIYG